MPAVGKRLAITPNPEIQGMLDSLKKHMGGVPYSFVITQAIVRMHRAEFPLSAKDARAVRDEERRETAKREHALKPYAPDPSAPPNSSDHVFMAVQVGVQNNAQLYCLWTPASPRSWVWAEHYWTRNAKPTDDPSWRIYGASCREAFSAEALPHGDITQYAPADDVTWGDAEAWARANPPSPQPLAIS